jgi:peptide/nickel transport system substrate-binding protein
MNSEKEKKMRKFSVLMAFLVIMTMILVACGPAPTPQVQIQTQVVVQTAAPVVQTQVVTQQVTKVVEQTKVVVATPVQEKDVTIEQLMAGTAALPRSQTMYFNGNQWGPVNTWNPYGSGQNNWVIAGGRELMHETAYMYNMLDGKLYGLLADGDYKWNDARTELTFKVKAAAKWSDGTAVTADDFAYTWAVGKKYSTNLYTGNSAYIADIVAADPQTVVIKAQVGKDGKALNTFLVTAMLGGFNPAQKAWTQKLEDRVKSDADKFKADVALDAPYTGAYGRLYDDPTKVLLIRNDKYWGQDKSMWGKLPVPKYLAHAIFKDNAAGTASMVAGQVDVSQEFISNVQDLWLKQKLPVSTYLADAPYDIGASLPTAFYNLNSYGLDQVAVRKAIAMAVDYDTIIANAMTNQSATFKQIPRSLMNPTDGEQAMYNKDAVKDLQWTGKDIEGAKKLLDDAGIKAGPDGFRTFNGKKLSYVATAPNGWSDWQAAIEVVAAAGKAIGIDITTQYPEWNVYQTVVTSWKALGTTKGYDIFMMWSDSAGVDQPWSRIRHLMSSEFAKTEGNWNGNWGGYKNADADKLIAEVPTLSDQAKVKDDYTHLVKLYLTDVPSFTLMYRPSVFHTVYEGVWTNFPHQGDGTKPIVPPTDCQDGYGVACLYNVKLVGK